MAMSLTSMTPPATTLTTYLVKWLEVATKNRIKLLGLRQSISVGSPFLVFKCSMCHSNWHVGQHLFFNSSNESVVMPSELTDWVKDHRHVCNSFKGSAIDPAGETCQHCLWPYKAHDESWDNIKPSNPTMMIKAGAQTGVIHPYKVNDALNDNSHAIPVSKFSDYVSLSNLNDWKDSQKEMNKINLEMLKAKGELAGKEAAAAVEAPKLKPLPEHKGRRFR